MMTLHDIAHRPWPMSRRPWVLGMDWHDLLFMHWPIKAESIRRYIPSALSIDTYDGNAWIGVVPFRMSRVVPRLIPPVPYLSAFPELNVRTYVHAEGKPGVWFFSLDAGNPIAVELARSAFHLNYYNAIMTCGPVGEIVEYSSVRRHRQAPAAAFQGRYRPTGPVYQSRPGTLESWLTERYCLYAANRTGSIWRSDIHHASWPLQPAEAEIERNRMTEQIRLSLPETTPLLHFARHLEVVAWLPERLALASPGGRQ
ncbi:MAG TPA: DUF2071 domain-containing protein [Roseiflexaceae bacterium]|nr:DUF2071 domain-containing protein [Roseiflexaceae bacterium]